VSALTRESGLRSGPELLADLKSAAPGPLYFCFGEEPFWADAIVRTLRERVVTPENRDFNEDILQAEETDGESVARIAASYPLMGERRLVAVRNIQKFESPDRKHVLAYAKSPLSSTCLVLTAGSVDRRQTFWAELSRLCVSVDCKPLYDNQAVEWIERAVRAKGARVTREAASALVARCGVSLWTLTQEIEKCLTYALGREASGPVQLGLEDVRAVAGFSREYATWDFADAVGSRNLGRALDVLEKLLLDNQSAPQLLVELYRRTVLLLRIRQRLDSGASPSSIGAALRLKPFFADLYLRQARSYSTEELKMAVGTLARADLHLKTGRLEPSAAVFFAVYDLARGTRRRRYFTAETG
jgi:DNA polymerase III subunit delta